MQNLNIAIIQTEQFWEDKKANFNHFDSHLQSISGAPDIIVLPEMFHTGFSMNSENLAETMDGFGVQWLKQQSNKYNAAIVASLIIVENGKHFNRMLFVEPNGELSYYDKRKLFGLAKEDQHYTAGVKNTIVVYKGWKLLLQVCYDLRFPELSRNVLSEMGEPMYDAIIFVANWPEKRSLHWKTLLQARAIENQCYVLAANRVGKDANDLNYSGDSSIINPLGEIMIQKSNEEFVLNEEINSLFLKETRKKLPFLKDQ
jgi:predicted amidohydrolase